MEKFTIDSNVIDNPEIDNIEILIQDDFNTIVDDVEMEAHIKSKKKKVEPDAEQDSETEVDSTAPETEQESDSAPEPESETNEEYAEDGEEEQEEQEEEQESFENEEQTKINEELEEIKERLSNSERENLLHKRENIRLSWANEDSLALQLQRAIEYATREKTLAADDGRLSDALSHSEALTEAKHQLNLVNQRRNQFKTAYDSFSQQIESTESEVQPNVNKDNDYQRAVDVRTTNFMDEHPEIDKNSPKFNAKKLDLLVEYIKKKNKMYSKSTYKEYIGSEPYFKEATEYLKSISKITFKKPMVPELKNSSTKTNLTGIAKTLPKLTSQQSEYITAVIGMNDPITGKAINTEKEAELYLRKKYAHLNSKKK